MQTADVNQPKVVLTALHDVLQIAEKFVHEDIQGKHHIRTEVEGYKMA